MKSDEAWLARPARWRESFGSIFSVSPFFPFFPVPFFPHHVLASVRQCNLLPEEKLA